MNSTAGSFDAQTLEEWLDYIEACHPAEIELGLERIRQVADRLGLGTPAPVSISIAGTNGKGSSVAMLEALLSGPSRRIGCYSSPHISRYNERIKVCGQEVSDRNLVESFRRIESARGKIPLTYFEFGTLAAFIIFADANLDVALLEVGLGGRLDAVNLIDADAALITSVGIDHTEWLGDSREAIASEKAGVFKPGRVAVCADPDPPVAIAAGAASVGAVLYQAGQDYQVKQQGNGWDWRCRDTIFEGLPLPKLPGRHQLVNAGGCLMVLKALDLLPDFGSIAAALVSARLPGRLQVVGKKPEIIVDVGHNPDAGKVIARWLVDHPAPGSTWAVVGMLARKNHQAFLTALNPAVDRWVFADLPLPAGARADQLARALGRSPEACAADVPEALEFCLDRCETADRILVTGSFLTVAAALGHLNP